MPTQPPTFEVIYSIDCLDEDTPVRGNASVSGNDQQDREIEDQILRDLEFNPWAWCCVRVTATLKDQFGHTVAVGVDYLGCCSYKNQEDFVAGNDYYEDMRRSAHEDLLKECQYLIEKSETARQMLKTAS